MNTATNGNIPLDVRRLTAADAAAYRAVRLMALLERPDAFGADHADEAAMPDTAFAERLERGDTFGGFIGGELRGTVTLIPAGGRKKSHCGLIVAMYVHPAARGHGLARALLDHLLAAARGRFEQVMLSVTTTNTQARRLYDAYGFEPYGIEPAALKIGDRYYDEELRVKRL